MKALLLTICFFPLLAVADNITDPPGKAAQTGGGGDGDNLGGPPSRTAQTGGGGGGGGGGDGGDNLGGPP